jgi:hypothetical protein
MAGEEKGVPARNEVRLYCDSPSGASPGLELQVDVAELVEEIVITPFADDWQVEAIQAAIEELLGPECKERLQRGRLKLRQSEHMRPPEVGWPVRSPFAKAHLLPRLTLPDLRKIPDMG